MAMRSLRKIPHRDQYDEERRAPGMQATKRRMLVVIAMLVSLWAGAGWAQALRVVGFNAESGGARPEVVAELIEATSGIGLWGFAEARDESWATVFTHAAAHGTTGAFSRILSTTGGSDRLLIMYNRHRLDVVQQFELLDINIGGHVRAP